MSSISPNDKNNLNKKKTEPFGELMKSMNDFFNEKPIRGFLQTIDEFFKTPFPPVSAFHVETVEKENEYIISAELPGVKKEQIHLNISGNYITISIENNVVEMEEDDKNQLFQRKFSRQQVSRTISLPQPINENMIKASYRDGLLQIRIPQEKGKTILLDD
ncbi:MAG TPA: Hsp20/alpha crystallin family protein [Neobacillus sp.]|jgi:HSP20 family molecular chaperone IbpA